MEGDIRRLWEELTELVEAHAARYGMYVNGSSCLPHQSGAFEFTWTIIKVGGEFAPTEGP